MKHLFSTLLLLTLTTLSLAQSMEDKFEQFKQQQNSLFNQFVSNKQAEYDAFRKRVNEEYAALMEKSWTEFKGQSAVQPQPKIKVCPINYEESQEEHQQATPMRKDKQIVVDIDSALVIVPQPAPTPEPIAPVQPQEDKQKTQRVSISFYGTLVSVQFPQSDRLVISSLDEKQLAEHWKQVSNAHYDITLANVLSVRKSLQLCDWGYLRLLQEITTKHYGSSNEAVFMQAFLMTQSGYQVRLGKDASRLYLLFASQYDLFGYNYFDVDDRHFYALDCDKENLHICEAFVEKENALSLQIAQTQKLDQEPSPKRTLTSKKGLTASVCVNRNQIDFYKSYPEGYLNDDVSTAWVAYANTPLDPKVKNQLYPIFEKKMENKSQREAADIILNWVQTAFAYEYDDKVWGGDRVFFASETLYYPYCDCEDRSILFSRMVRDLLHLPVVLLYYPGHLATAVAFEEDVAGDYVAYNGKRYVVCDPTFIGAPVGRTMSGMDNKQATVVVLQ